MQFFLDFDDTLVVGPTTWAIKHVFPTMIREYNLPNDPAALHAAILDGQRDATTGADDATLLDALFRRMNWPDELKGYLFQEVFHNYTPSLFDDTLPFLRRLIQRGKPVYVISNNPRSPAIAHKLGIAAYITEFFTPQSCGLSRGKPYRDIWDYIRERHPTNGTILIGDDPWSDGAFAEECGLLCYILDRMDRFASIPMPHLRIRTLDSV